MDVITGLVTFIVVLFVAVYIAQPYFAVREGRTGGSGERTTAAILKQQADLLAQRNEIYAAITELDFDYQTNKVSDEDYADQRYRLVAQGVEVLQELDGLPPIVEDEDPIEAAIRAVRTGEPVPRFEDADQEPAQAAAFCPACGQKAHPGDKFCGSCGNRL